jgi:HK97 family phage prohead protease
MDRIIRNVNNAQLRATDDEKHTIEGYAIVFNQRSLLLPDFEKWKMVNEVILPEAVSRELINQCDITANFNHNDNKILARSVNGEGSLSLNIDDIGVAFSFDCPQSASDVYEGIKRGDLRGCSFAYSTDEDVTGNITYDSEDEQLIRNVHHIDRLYDVSIVVHPAYPQTSVEARQKEIENIKRALTNNTDELKKREAEEKEREKIKLEMQRDYDKLSAFSQKYNY